MKKSKRILKGVINWFKVKYVNGVLKKQIESLIEQVKELSEENEALNQMLDKDRQLKRIKSLENRRDELIAQKRALINENKEYKRQIEEYKILYQIED